MTIIAMLIGAYLIGGIPSAVWVSKIFYGKDIREYGSHNAGLTNIYRLLGTKAAIPVAIADLAKGMLVVWLSLGNRQEFMAPVNFGIVVGLIAILGHSFTCFAGFKGGKGVLTALGVFLVLIPFSALGAFAVWSLVLWLWGYVSVASIAAAGAISLFTFIEWLLTRTTPVMTGFTLALSLFIVYRHLPNIERLKNGTENRFGTRSKFK